jgi:UDP-N-acetylglucosamine 2-epimerase (non-hydrolysing)
MESDLMKKICVVFGTRPEAIKLAPVILELRKYPEQFKTSVIVTAQHREMLDQVLRIFEIVPDFDLNLMKENQTLADITASTTKELSKILENERPDMIIVQGDTTTTFVTALTAFYYKIKIGHVEAGLRTFNKYSPFPEEINRRITSVLADVHFAPTAKPKANLIAEGVSQDKILITGNTVIDALFWMVDKLKNEDKTYQELKRVDFTKKIILVTGHRRENFGEQFMNICNALKQIAVLHRDIEIVYPVHLNPNVRKPVYEILANVPNVKLIEPLDYEPFIYLMEKSFFIISDSGGIQEEAPSLGKPVLVTRNTTERPEAVDCGAVKLVGTDYHRILEEATSLITNPTLFAEMSNKKNPYGDGKASAHIVDYLKKNI